MFHPFTSVRVAIQLDNTNVPAYLVFLMARQAGDIKITGTVEGLCFYRMEGNYYVRRQSSLTGKRFWRDQVFAGSRRSAGLLQQASPIASGLYRRLPKSQKGRKVFQVLVGAVKRHLAEGWEESRIALWFEQVYLNKPESQVASVVKKKMAKPASSKTKVGQQLSLVVVLPVPVAGNRNDRKVPYQLFFPERERGSPDLLLVA